MRWIFLFILFLPFVVKSQQLVSGQIINAQDEPIGFCHVYNETMGLGKVSDMKGKFSVTGNQGDTILFSYVGYSELELILGPEHLNQYLRVELVEDSLLLPSITIYSDPYFKVPFRFKGIPMYMEGISIPGPKRRFRAGTFYSGIHRQAGDPLAPGVGISGPITYFSKDEREKRKAEVAYRETEETINFQKFVAQDSVRKKLCERYAINDEQYTEVITRLNRRFPDMHKTHKPSHIYNWLLAGFDHTVPIIKQYQFIIEDN